MFSPFNTIQHTYRYNAVHIYRIYLIFACLCYYTFPARTDGDKCLQSIPWA